GNYLSFDNETSFKKAVKDMIQRSPKEQKDFEKSNGYTSLATRFVEYNDKIRSMESKKDTSGFFILKPRYDHVLYWKATDEYYFNAPDWETALLINENGLVKIDNEIYKLNKDKTIKLKNGDLQTLRTAITERNNIDKDAYKVQLLNPDRDNANGIKNQTARVWPWLRVTGTNPAEGQTTIGISQQNVSTTTTKRLYYQVRVINVRKAGIVYCWAELQYRAQAKQFIFWQWFPAREVKLDGGFGFKFRDADGFFSATDLNFSNIGITDRYYQTYYNPETWGTQILGISSNFVYHPDPYSIISSPAHAMLCSDLRNHPDGHKFIFNDQDLGDQSGPDFYLKIAGAGWKDLLQTPSSFNCWVGGAPFDISF
ncbi:MAG TPA: hypothetical protein VM802_00815, partial [Chitinophaga sp.]|uniref:hypothetical protein n=1 Tax=Chitinophaga sp. TaxID=1869181 RepID=UPI002C8F50AC